jgi:hypothetical protein
MVSSAVTYTGPGVMLDYQAIHYSDGHVAPDIFISDPEILVLSNGTYVAAHAVSGWLSGASSSGMTSLFRSTDRGTTWTTIGTYSGITRGSLFELNGVVYLFGAHREGGNAAMMKSTDGGLTWTAPTSFAALNGSATPNNPVVFGNRIWSAAGTSVHSAPIYSNLMVEASWKLTGGFPASSADWLTGTAFSGEGQIVASAALGVFVLPKTTDYMYTKVAKVNASGTVTFDPTNNFAALPGAEKKFGAAYDPVSSNFYVLSNTIMPQDYGVALPNMIRNSAAVLTSRDLFNWKVEKIIIHSADAARDGFCYLNFALDDTNMVVAARTAFPVGSDDPTRGHDSNLLTIHKLNGFRHLTPDHYLQISGGQVLRYERTAYQDAALGSFALGDAFAGAALTLPNGIGADATGDVYIRESGGRILRFDVLGNFIETNRLATVSFSSGPLDIKQPASGECAWINSGSGDWSDLLHWYYWGRPDTTGEIAVFGSAATAAATITIPSKTQSWEFSTTGNNEGWTASNASDLTVATANGVLKGTVKSAATSVYIYRTDRFFYGSPVPEIRVRMSASINGDVNLWWGTTEADSVSDASQKVTCAYTSNGAEQEIVFSLAGNEKWSGKAITRLRIDPLGTAININGATFSMSAITVPRESYRLKGLRFLGPNPYTLDGAGQLRLEADRGSCHIDVLQGEHTNNVALLLGSDTEVILTNSASLHLKKGIDLNGRTLQVTGSGTLLMQGALVMNGGRLTVDGTTPLTFTDSLTGTALNGTLQFLPDETCLRSGETNFVLLDNPVLLGTNRFSAVMLPALSAGLEWNTQSLYSAGNVWVQTVRHTLVVTTPRGTGLPAPGTNTYDYGVNLIAAITDSPVLDGATTQYVCRGWSGTGSVPASGTSTNTGLFTLTTNSTVTWLWATQYWLDTAATSGGGVDISSGWMTNGAIVQVTATSNVFYHLTGWSGDVTTNSAQITLLMNRARSVTANFAPNVTANTETPEWWLAQYGLTNFTAEAAADADGDGLLSWQEYVAGTDPTNPASVLQITGGAVTAQSVVIRWSSVSNRLYSLSRTTNLTEAFTALPGASNLPATPPENSYTHPAPVSSAAFYRITVR